MDEQTMGSFMQGVDGIEQMLKSEIVSLEQ